MDVGVHCTCTPAATAASACPVSRAERPKWVATREAEQAVSTPMLGPCKPSMKDTRPAATLTCPCRTTRSLSINTHLLNPALAYLSFKYSWRWEIASRAAMQSCTCFRACFHPIYVCGCISTDSTCMESAQAWPSRYQLHGSSCNLPCLVLSNSTTNRLKQFLPNIFSLSDVGKIR